MIHAQLTHTYLLKPKHWAYLHNMSNKSNKFWKTDQRCVEFSKRLGKDPIELKREMSKGRQESNKFDEGIPNNHWKRI